MVFLQKGFISAGVWRDSYFSSSRARAAARPATRHRHNVCVKKGLAWGAQLTPS